MKSKKGEEEEICNFLSILATEAGKVLSSIRTYLLDDYMLEAYYDFLLLRAVSLSLSI